MSTYKGHLFRTAFPWCLVIFSTRGRPRRLYNLKTPLFYATFPSKYNKQNHSPTVRLKTPEAKERAKPPRRAIFHSRTFQTERIQSERESGTKETFKSREKKKPFARTIYHIPPAAAVPKKGYGKQSNRGGRQAAPLFIYPRNRDIPLRATSETIAARK